MAHMRDGWPKAIALLTSVLFSGCHRASYSPESMRIDGFRYSAGSAVVGAAFDTLRVAVVVVNDSRQYRELGFPSCPPMLNPLKIRVTASRREWDSETSEIRKQPVYLDSTGKPIPRVCVAMLPVMTFPPGASYTYVLKVPVTAVLGDSLPKGRYQVTAQLRINGYLTGRLPAGYVKFSSPPI
jgi:hypothetical protein